jgi:hypothetical protein
VLNAEKFRVFIKGYLTEKYAENEVYITDGPYDGGNDLTIIANGREIKKNLQVTVQKENLDKKITEDLIKANANVAKFSYLNRLEFYYSQKITNSYRNDQKLNAEINYAIDLNIIDANFLAQDLESYPKSRKKLLDLLNIKEDNEFVKVDKQTKVVYDMLANAQETGEMKKQFVLSFIFTYLYENPRTTIEDLMTGIGKKLPFAPDLKFFRDNLSALKGKGTIITEETKKLFSLSVEKTKEVDDIYAQALIQENQLKQALELVLTKYDLVEITNELSDFIVKAYQANYMMDVDELSHRSKASPVTKIMFELRSYLKNKGVEDSKTEVLTREVLKACNDNDYLNKVSASILFANLYESDKLDDYLNNRSQYFYLDTQILLRLICFQYKDVEWDDLAFKSVKDFYQTVRGSKHSITLLTTYNYLVEVASHFQEALRLQRFYDLPNYHFEKKSRNVFCNFYFFLQHGGLIEEDTSLEDFFDDLLGIDIPGYDRYDFIHVVAKRLSDLYSMMNIEVISIEYLEDFQLFKKEYEIQLAYDDKFRPSKVIDNDIQLIIELSNLNNHLDNRLAIRSEPFLVTWDREFYTFRKTLMDKFQIKGYGYFYIYSPSKLSDRVSVASFKLNPKSIDYNIISLTENNFNLLYKTSSYIDILSYFFEKRDLSELQTAQKLLAMESHTKNVDGKIEKEEVFEDSSDIQGVLLGIRKHYMDNAEAFTFEDLVKVFENNEMTEYVLAIIEKARKVKQTTESEDKNSVFIELNELMKKASHN